jgi:hypothetical protein
MTAVLQPAEHTRVSTGRRRVRASAHGDHRHDPVERHLQRRGLTTAGWGANPNSLFSISGALTAVGPLIGAVAIAIAIAAALSHRRQPAQTCARPLRRGRSGDPGLRRAQE